jgi:guanine deaminase
MILEEAMRQAIAMAQRGIAAGQTPFGAAIICDEEVIACNHNTVWQDKDPTAHAEVNTIRTAGKLLQKIDFSDAEMVSTCEPCPMCLSAIHWAKLKRIVYGATIADAAAAGFSELEVPAKTLAEMGGSHLIVESGLLQAECADLFRQFKAGGGKGY